jgi:uncharacterized protein YciI
MHIVFLQFTERKSEAGKFMQGHKDWIQRGFDAGCFLLTGSLQPQTGGVILADRISREELDHLLEQDPFVEQGIVTSNIVELAPSRVDTRLGFLLD